MIAIIILVLILASAEANKRENVKHGITEFDTSREQRIKSFNDTTSATWSTCPLDYPYPLNDLKHCCQHLYTLNNTTLNAECDGSMLKYKTSLECCPEGQSQICPSPPCGFNGKGHRAILHKAKFDNQTEMPVIYFLDPFDIIDTQATSGAPLPNLTPRAGKLFCNGWNLKTDYMMCGCNSYTECFRLGDTSWETIPTAVLGTGHSYNIPFYINGAPWFIMNTDTEYLDTSSMTWLSGPSASADLGTINTRGMAVVAVSSFQAIMTGGISSGSDCNYRTFLINSAASTYTLYPGGNTKLCREDHSMVCVTLKDETRIALILGGVDVAGDHVLPEKSVIGSTKFGPWIVDASMDLKMGTAATVQPECREWNKRWFCIFTYSDGTGIQEFHPFLDPPWKVWMDSSDLSRGNALNDGIFFKY